MRSAVPNGRRVLAHADPIAALAEIERVAGPGLITHIVSPQALETEPHLWQTAADLHQGQQVADALSQIWVRRTKARGAPNPFRGVCMADVSLL